MIASKIIVMLVVGSFFIPFCSCNRFRILSTIPENRKLNASVGDNVIMSCIASAKIRKCNWELSGTDSICKLWYSAKANALVKRHCHIENHLHRVFVVGNQEKHECAIRFDNVTMKESGTWMCDLKEYVSHFWIFTSAYWDGRAFQLNITEPTEKEQNTKHKQEAAEMIELQNLDNYVDDEEIAIEEEKEEDNWSHVLRPLAVTATVLGSMVVMVGSATGCYICWKRWNRHSTDIKDVIRLVDMKEDQNTATAKEDLLETLSNYDEGPTYVEAQTHRM